MPLAATVFTPTILAASGTIGIECIGALRTTNFLDHSPRRPWSKAPFYLVGDEAYHLRTFLIRPFPRTVLTDDRREFNRRISRVCQCIQCAFGILAAKWRCLKTELSPAKVDNVAKACCILRYLIIDKEGLLVRPSRGALAEELSRQSVGRQSFPTRLLSKCGIFWWTISPVQLVVFKLNFNKIE